MVVWVTGLSGAGKTTVCQLLYERLKPTLPELVFLDGDEVREAVSLDLGFAETERIQHISRVQRLARLLAVQNLVVLVAVVYANPELLAWNRANIPDYFEVLIDLSVDAVRARDPKGHYARLASGETKNVVGEDLPWHRPTTADLIINLASCPRPEDGAHAIARAVPQLGAHWLTAGVGT